MSDRSQDELRQRFNRTPDRDGDDDGSDDTSNTSGTSNSSKTGGTNETSKTDKTEQSQSESSVDSDGLKERKQVAMYLPADQRSDLVDFYEELDARSTLAGEGGLEKNREFYEGMVEFVLNRREKFATSLGIELDD
ncbi:hypothetical protein [Halocatena marina]|uniref:hypothetical protein n=1 Tax=Halocatena marina TaxID=2934937 RepID=UPI00200E896E|nr:hypothetical protein [Halocatena marina]